MDLLDRLFHKLVEVTGQQVGDTRGARFTIADLYQHLVPYRAVRAELGVHELALYEHTLLRLLSGERGYLRLESPEVEAELRRELASTNPILGIYRDYAGEAVELTGDPRRAPSQIAVPAVAPAPSGPPAPPPPEEPLPEPSPPEPAAPPTSPACRHCDAPLPDDVEVHFCPSCGASQREVPCAGCGHLLRAEWNFCVRCGTPRAGR